MAKSSQPVDEVLTALADPTRRGVVERLGRGAASVSELARAFPMALPSFMKHLAVLEARGLIRSRKHGRVRICELDRDRLRVVEAWLVDQHEIWTGRTDRLEAFVTER